VRVLDQSDTKMLRGTEPAASPFFALNDTTLGFIAALNVSATGSSWKRHKQACAEPEFMGRGPTPAAQRWNVTIFEFWIGPLLSSLAGSRPPSDARASRSH